MMLGLVIGIASLTAVICIGQGTRAKVMDMVAKQGWDLIMIRAGAANQVFAPTTDRTIASLVEADAQAIERVERDAGALLRERQRLTEAARTRSQSRTRRPCSTVGATFGIDQYYLAEETGWVLYLENSTDLSILQAFSKSLGHEAQRYLERPFVKYVETNLPPAAAAQV